MPALPKHILAAHRVTGYIAFDVPSDDCAVVKITMEAAVKDLGGEITTFSYIRDDHLSTLDVSRFDPLPEEWSEGIGDIERYIDRVGRGWRPLLRGLDINLRDLDPDYTIEQIKRKSGGLSFYCSSTNVPDWYDETHELIMAAKDLSFCTCEDCGASGTIRVAGDSWLKTLCAHCYQDYEIETGEADA